jgi:hydroxyethylthiazole kinase-like uncharacterized protein yjeF
LKSNGRLVYLTAEEMAEADNFAIDVVGIDVDSLMENAGARTAELVRSVLGGRVVGRKLTVLVGRGNNGGDGLVAARHLHNWGGDVTVTLGEGREKLRGTPAKQLAIVEKMGIRTLSVDEAVEADLIVDALLGYGASGNPREPLASLIRKTVASKTPIVAVDIPSGLDATTGASGDPCILAQATVTFGFPKEGFLNPDAKPFIGDLYLADISLPKSIYEKYSCQGIFSEGSLFRVW